MTVNIPISTCQKTAPDPDAPGRRLVICDRAAVDGSDYCDQHQDQPPA